MTDTDTPPKQVRPDDYRVEEMEAAIEHAMEGKCEFRSDRFQAHRYEDGSVQATVKVIVGAEQYAAWLESEACREWRETTIAGLRSELAKTREKLRRAEAKKATKEQKHEASNTSDTGGHSTEQGTTNTRAAKEPASAPQGQADGVATSMVAGGSEGR